MIRPSGTTHDRIHLATLPDATIDLLTRQGELLRLSFMQHFEVKHGVLGYKVVTRAYYYAVEDESGNEIVAHHWHPAHTIQYPHLHIGYGAGERLRPEIRAMHFRTDRFAFEEFCMTLINEFGVEPKRPDAMQILELNLHNFRKQRSWTTWP